VRLHTSLRFGRLALTQYPDLGSGLPSLARALVFVFSMESGHSVDIRGVALDLDGVIIDGMPFHIRAWEDAFAHHGFAVDQQDLYELEGIRTPEVVDRLAIKYDLPLSSSQKTDLARRKRERYADIFTVVPLPGAQELVQSLADLHYRLALVTGTTRAAGERTLAELGVSNAFTCVVSGDDVETGKPAPDSYALAVRCLEVTPRRCLAVENAPAGIEAAHAAGLPCVVVATYLSPSSLMAVDGADLVFEEVPALAAWFLEEAQRTGAHGPFVPVENATASSLSSHPQ
jgi:beta-phosphoglucomutase